MYVQGRILSKQGPVQKKMCGPLPGAADPIFLEKMATFLVITVCQLSVLQCQPYIFSPEKLATCLLVITVAFIHFTRSLGCRPLFLTCCYIAKNLPLLLWGPFL